MSRIRARLKVTRPGFTLDVDLDLPGQGVSALFGPSGCGKTTSLRAVAGLERASAGQVEIDGELWQDDAQSVFVPTHRRALGYVFQETRLFPHLSVAANVAYGQQRVPPPQRRVSLQQAVDLLGIAALMDRRPETLSGGERQRAGIAQALATSPRLLLLDEPLAALDTARKNEVLPYLERLHAELGIPVLYVSHSIDEVARLADHMVLMEAGRVLASGATAQLLASTAFASAQGDAAGAVIDGVVLGHDAGWQLTQVAFEGGSFQLAGALNRRIGDRVRLRVQARDVSLTLLPQTGTSILNILPATVLAVDPDRPGQVIVLLAVGGTRLLARLTQRSAAQLQLTPGQSVHAQVKGVALLA